MMSKSSFLMKVKYYRYRIASQILWGDLRKKYNIKRKKLKESLKERNNEQIYYYDDLINKIFDDTRFVNPFNCMQTQAQLFYENIKFNLDQIKVEQKNNLNKMEKKIETLQDDALKYYHKSYSLSGEDLLLYAFLTNNEKVENKGIYIDIGAYHPKKCSNTKFFYDQGWRGINIDAMPQSMNDFMGMRSEDINLEIGVTSKNGSLPYYSFENSKYNSFDKALSEEKIQKDIKLKEILDIKVMDLNSILYKYISENMKIDFISLNTDNNMDILSVFDFEKYSPKYFLVNKIRENNTQFILNMEKENSKDSFNLLMNKQVYIPVANTLHYILYKKII